MNNSSMQKVVVLGGYGTFGSLIASELAHTANVVVAGRNRAMGQKFADSIAAAFSLCNARDNASLRNIIAGARIVINATGPFLPNDFSIPRICIEENCHYIDLADDRAYVRDFLKLGALAEEKRVFACTGASTAPAVTFALLSELSLSFHDLHSIKIYMNAGNKNKPGVSTFESILSYAGTPVRVWNNNQWETHMGWGLAEVFEFPAPVGKRFVQLCNIPDLELFPTLFEADQVIFKAGVELPIFNVSLSILAQLKKRFPWINLPAMAQPLVKISRLFKSFGSYSGGILVKVDDHHGNSKSLAFITSQNGPRLPASPAVLLTRRLLNDDLDARGAFPCVRFIELREFQNHLEPFGIKLIAQ
jgi:NAD(P)-dependent dehydrogenase (short-subunit alcohol dehydrogenase family)